MALFSQGLTFGVDPSVVSGSDTVDISAITLYFMYRPNPLNNRSGIQYPGITMWLTDVVGDVPNVANSEIYAHRARAEWSQILTSSDASQPTVFNFDTPVRVKTGRMYAAVWLYDGGEDFLPWTNIRGNFLVGTTNPSPGPSSPYGGKYFQFSGISNTGVPTNVDNYATAWTPLQDVDVKFQVSAARYAVNGVPVSANTSLPPGQPLMVSGLQYSFDANTGIITLSNPSPRTEIIAFDPVLSLKQAFVGPQRVYQDSGIDWPGRGVTASLMVVQGSNTITANSLMSDGNSFSWTTVLGDYAGEKWVVVRDSNQVDLRKVTAIVSNTVVTVDEALTFTNSASRFYVSPTAIVDGFNTSPVSGRKQGLMFLRDSSANATVRFTPDSLRVGNVSVANTGTGYSNSDTLYLLGYDSSRPDNYPAIAGIVTDGSGNVVSLQWSNTGSGFSNGCSLLVQNSASNSLSSNTSAGSGLTLSTSFGSVIRTEQTNNYFTPSRPIDLDVHRIFPVSTVERVANTVLSLAIDTQYYQVSNVTLVGEKTTLPLVINQDTPVATGERIPVVVSRSNEFGVRWANGAPNDRAEEGASYSPCWDIVMTTQSQNDWVSVGPITSPLVGFSRYLVNDDYAGEEGDSGDALARHITTIFNFTGPAATNRMSEDVRVYLSALRQPGTDLQVYARIKNSGDNQAFSDEDWTRLQLLETNNFSSTGFTDLTYGFQPCPNTGSTLVGTVSISNNSANLTGTSTTFSTDLANGDLVKVYDPLFADDDFAVVRVSNVVSNTTVTVDQVFSTNTAAGIGGPELTGRDGLRVDKIPFPHQGFNNSQLDNVVRYYNQSGQVWDGYDTLQLKVVMLTTDPRKIPGIKSVRLSALSA
jgi:hypothetical protein